MARSAGVAGVLRRAGRRLAGWSGTGVRFGGWWGSRRWSLLYVAVGVVVAGVVQAVNQTGAPQRIDDEGTYVAQAFAVDRLGALAPYTYWYDHPPLGWIQLAGWTWLTDGFARYGSAVMAGREFMAVCTVVSTVLVWLLARRMGLSRPGAAVALGIWSLSPLAVQFHRTVFLDNIATPWLLAAFVLVYTARRQLAAFAAAAGCFAIACLSKETYALFAPFLVWQMWRGADRRLRRYTVPVATAVVVLLGFGYVLLALIKGELFPGPHKVSLLSGIGYQLAGRAGSGSLFDPASQARVTTGMWWHLDPVLCLIAPAAALVALASRRARPVAAALVFLLVFMLRPGYLPIPYVVAMIPLGALVVPAAVETVVAWRRRGDGSILRTVAMQAGVLVLAAAVGIAGPLWAVKLRGLWLSNLDAPMVQAEAWITGNVGRDYRVVVDDSMWVDLVRAGFPRDNVIWYYKVDTDPAVERLAPQGWRDYDYIVSTNSMRTFPNGSATVATALRHSVKIATFGHGPTEVDIWRIETTAMATVHKRQAADRRAAGYAGTQLAANPAVTTGPGVKDLLTGGRVDARVLIAAGLLARTGPLTLAAVPPVPGEQAVHRPRRTMVISRFDHQPIGPHSAHTISAILHAQPPPYAPRSIHLTGRGLEVRYSVDAPTGLLTAPPN